MDKKQQIEEIEEVLMNKEGYIEQSCDKCKYWIRSFCSAPISCQAEAIYNAGYRKIDENCAVITKDELKAYKSQAVKEFAGKLKEKCSDYLYRTNFDGKNDFDIHIGELSRMIDELSEEF